MSDKKNTDLDEFACIHCGHIYHRHGLRETFCENCDRILEIKKVDVDIVNHPPHYKDESGIECIEVTQHMGFCEGNSFKYVYRAGSKGNLIEDLKKAAWYAEKSWKRNRCRNARVHWLVQRKGEVVANSRGKEGEIVIAEIMINIVNSRWWQAYDLLMNEIKRLESEVSE